MNNGFPDPTSLPPVGAVTTPPRHRSARHGGEIVRAHPAVPAARPDLPGQVARVHMMRELLALVHARAFASGRASVSAPRRTAARPLYVHTVPAAPSLEPAAALFEPPSGRWPAAPTDPSARPPLRPPAGRAGGPELRPRILAGFVFVLFVLSLTVATDLTGDRWATTAAPAGPPAGVGSAELPVVQPPIVPAPILAPVSPIPVAEPAPRQAPRTRPPAPLPPESSDTPRSEQQVPSASREIPPEFQEAARLAERWQREMPSSPFGR
ncbi:MAG: hypothetical protein ACRDRH_06450 [Pseudonocardia sp.]